MVKAALAIVAAMLAVPAPAQTVAEAFVDVLRRDDARLLAAALHPAARPADVANLREIVDTYDCTWVDDFTSAAVSGTAEEIVVHVELEGGAAMKAAWRPKIALPRFWRIAVGRDGAQWKITRAETEERTVAAAMAAASSVAEADAILAAARPQLDRYRIVAEYTSAAGKARIDHLRALAAAAGDARTGITVRRQIAVLTRGTPQALEEASAAVALAEAQGTPDDRAAALLTLGTNTYLTGDFRGALDIYTRAVDLVELADDPIPSMKALHMRGFMHTLLYDNAGVLRDAERLRDLTARYGWLEGEEVAALRRGQTLGILGHIEIARAAYEDAKRIGLRNGNAQFLGIILHAIAELDSILGNQQAAIDGFRQALAVEHQRPSWLMLMRYSLASTYLEVGDLARAGEVVREAKAAFDGSSDPQEKIARAKILELEAHILLLQGKSQAALDTAAASLRELGGDWNKNAVYKLHSIAGRALRQLNRPAEAAAELRAAIEAVDGWLVRPDEVLLPPRVQEPRLDAHLELIDLLVDGGQIDEAFFVAEQMKARSLRAELAHGRIDVSASMSAEERAKEKALEERIVERNRAMLQALVRETPLDEVRGGMAKARAERDAFVSEMRSKYRDIGRRRIAPERSIALPPSAEPFAVVEYVVGETRTTVFAIVDGKVRAGRIDVPRRELERAANEVALLIGSRSARWRGPASALHRLLLAPVERWTRNAKVLCIVPDRALWSVPFHALVDGEGVHLVDRHVVFYAHSLTLLRSAWSSRSEAPSRLIAFGNPAVGGTAAKVRSVFRDVTIGPLPDAETEVRSLAPLYPRSSRIYVRDAAREGVFKRDASQYEIVHLAAHALVDARAPMYSAIVLAGGRDRAEDGLLEAREIADAALHARLVVLSACDTARGRAGAGEGVLGLAWAFFAAGAPTTVGSQWKTESRSTSRLMVAFHERLAAGDSTAAALRRAQLALRRSPQYAHPFYWAPFVAIGAAGRDLSSQ